MDPPSYSEAVNEADGDTLIIALDFGTTFSGVAYAYSTDPDKIYTITNWPGGEDRIAPKTPTTIQYDAGSTTSFKWGYELDLSPGEKITALKLLLDPGQDRPYYIPDSAGAELDKLPKSVVEVASDYIKAIFEHALAEIEADVLDPSFLDGYRKAFVLTVPAVWSDKAKDMTLRAATQAGISPIEMITEPEAASLYTLMSVKDKGLQRGDAIVVCDAGGGTVDLVSYEIQSMDPFELKALTAPSGGVCGSIILNRRFEEEVKDTVGPDAYAKLSTKSAYRSALKDFDGAIKVGFRGKDDPDRFVSFPMAGLKDNKARGLVSNSMTLSGATIYRIFNPIISNINILVSEQVAKVRAARMHSRNKKSGPRAVFLVGGFGSSAYLKTTIERSNPGVLVMQPKEAWSAIVKGAVMGKLRLAPTVTATKATKHYGTTCNSTWTFPRDEGYPMFKSEWEEKDRCKTMKWFIYKDEDLVRSQKIKLSFCRRFGGLNPPSSELRCSNRLYECHLDKAPDHPEDVKVNCTLKTDFDKVPRSCFIEKKRRSDGADYIQIDYHLIIENDASGLMKFSLEVDGKEYSAVQASY